MHDTATLKKHAALFDEMGRSVGLDLQQQALEGRLLLDEISEAVLRCAKCSQPDHCASVMADRDAQMSAPPNYCRNRDLFAYLHEQNC